MTLAQAVAAPLCERCGFVRAVNGTLCAHCTLVTERVRELLAAGLTVRGVAEALGVHERAVTAVCVCHVTDTERHEHPQCPRHVLDVERRRRGAIEALIA